MKLIDFVIPRVAAFFGFRASKVSDSAQVVAESVPVRIGKLTKPWKRGTFREDMEPTKSYNFHGTFCRTCGDWIEDGAYYSQHDAGHKPLRGSWNYEMPHMKRRGPDEIKPGHEEWLEEIKEYASKHEGISFSGTGIPIDPHHDCAFHSQEEADAILSPFGIKNYWCPDSGWVTGGHAEGSWMMSGSSKPKEQA